MTKYEFLFLALILLLDLHSKDKCKSSHSEVKVYGNLLHVRFDSHAQKKDLKQKVTVITTVNSGNPYSKL